MLRRAPLTIVSLALAAPCYAQGMVGVLQPGPEPEGYEVKVLIEADDQRRALELIDRDEDDYVERRVYFVDTPDKDLLREGIVLRARESDDGVDTTVKLRGPTVDFTPFAALQAADEVKTEVDMIGPKSVNSVSYTAERAGAGYNEDEPLDEFTTEQLAFTEQHTGYDLTALDLRVFGDVRSRRWRRDHDNLGRVSVERWIFVDGSRLLEISIMADDRAEAEARQATLLDELDAAGIRVTSAQTSKTQRAMGGD